jgi:predicted amidohydrolase
LKKAMTGTVIQTRRRFVAGAVAGAVGGIRSTVGAAEEQDARRQPGPAGRPQRVTLAQVITTGEITLNLGKAELVMKQAGKDGAQWVLFPELFLTGTHNGNRYRQAEVAPAFAQMQAWCRQYGVIGLIGTGWTEGGKNYNQVRIVDAQGSVASIYAKTCLTYGDAKEFEPGSISLVHTAGGIRFGVLICNDLWVTPGFSAGPDPHLSLKQARAGAQVIFHAIGSGSDQRYRSYHESNLLVRAAEAACPIVAVNGFKPPEVNATSGVVGTNFSYLDMLPRDREAIKTVEFTPALREG